MFSSPISKAILLKTKWGSFLGYYTSYFYFVAHFFKYKSYTIGVGRGRERWIKHNIYPGIIQQMCTWSLSVWGCISHPDLAKESWWAVMDVDGWVFQSVAWLWFLKHATSWGQEGLLSEMKYYSVTASLFTIQSWKILPQCCHWNHYIQN